MASIFKILEDLKLTSDHTKELFSSSTRDIEKLNVFCDSQSGVIFIDEFYVGDKIYEDGEYRVSSSKENHSTTNDPMVEIDALRRFKDFKDICIEKSILDFGCGHGSFLLKIKDYAADVTGIELQESFIKKLSENGISAYNSLDSVEDESIDVIFLFHVFEHLPDPLTTLAEIKKKLKKGGVLILEVPHANDFLLSFIKSEAFRKFTLWSQHLILHTKESIAIMLEHTQFNGISVKGVQRYPLSNHIHWIRSGMPGGHLQELAALDSEQLHKSYQDSLDKINATDTIVAYGHK
jgi:2-polyprenyl-3-methyl-5-hydroxy-6-metoxy-1,4-benzoquinol methylase